MKKCVHYDIQGFADMLKVISQSNRLQIICLLAKRGELCVLEILEYLNLKQNLVSHHLSILKDIGLLTTRRDGKKIYYALDKQMYENIKSTIKNIFNI